MWRGPSALRSPTLRFDGGDTRQWCAGCHSSQSRYPAPGHRVALRWSRPGDTTCDLLKPLERVGILANEEHQRGRLGIGFGAALLPLFEGSQVNAELSRKHGAGATQFLARAPNEFCIDFRKRRGLHFKVAKGQLAFVMAFHCRFAFHQLAKNVALGHWRNPPLPGITSPA